VPSTRTEVASERNSTLIFPLPVELLRLVDTVNQRMGLESAAALPTAPGHAS
jgi:hypothetical protein